MFLDEITITVRGGKGGDGIVSFRREKFKPKGGPDGGNGGDGGNVIIRANNSYRDLFHLSGKHHFIAGDGKRGGSNRRKGARGKNLIIEVPPGTLVKDADTGEIVVDLKNEEDEVIIAKGGEGGYGNCSQSAIKIQSTLANFYLIQFLSYPNLFDRSLFRLLWGQEPPGATHLAVQQRPHYLDQHLQWGCRPHEALPLQRLLHPRVQQRRVHVR
jgi:hypothetical protein